MVSVTDCSFCMHAALDLQVAAFQQPRSAVQVTCGLNMHLPTMLLCLDQPLDMTAWCCHKAVLGMFGAGNRRNWTGNRDNSRPRSAVARLVNQTGRRSRGQATLVSQALPTNPRSQHLDLEIARCKAAARAANALILGAVWHHNPRRAPPATRQMVHCLRGPVQDIGAA